ncbi:hypothetical protein GUI12_03480 [Anaplasmataceae bacterium AB001_6]|nr:hypothetical protein GUI12_03480 [Anaplasmataceae bacterium AB001_6]
MLKKFLISDIINLLKRSEGGVYFLFDQENNFLNAICDILNFSAISIKYIHLNFKSLSKKSNILEHINANYIFDDTQQCLWDEKYTVYIIPHLDIDGQYLESIIDYFSKYNSKKPFLLFFNSDNTDYNKNSKNYHIITSKFNYIEFSLLSHEYILYIIQFLICKFNLSFDIDNKIFTDKVVDILEKFKLNNIYERLKSLMLYYYGEQCVSSDCLIQYLIKDYHELYLSKIFISYYEKNKKEFLSNMSTASIIDPILFIRAMMSHTIYLLNTDFNAKKSEYKEAVSLNYRDKWSQSNIKKVLNALYIAEKDYKSHLHSFVFFYQKLIIELLIIIR